MICFFFSVKVGIYCLFDMNVFLVEGIKMEGAKKH